MFAVARRRLSDTPGQLLGQNTLPGTFVPLIFAVAIQADTSEAKEHHWAPESTRRVATAWAWRGECTAFRSPLSRRRSPSTAALGSPRSSVPRGTVSLPCGTVRPHPRSGGYLLPQAEPEFEVAQPLAKAGPLFCALPAHTTGQDVGTANASTDARTNADGPVPAELCVVCRRNILAPREGNSERSTDAANFEYCRPSLDAPEQAKPADATGDNPRPVYISWQSPEQQENRAEPRRWIPPTFPRHTPKHAPVRVSHGFLLFFRTITHSPTPDALRILDVGSFLANHPDRVTHSHATAAADSATRARC